MEGRETSALVDFFGNGVALGIKGEVLNRLLQAQATLIFSRISQNEETW